MNNIHTVPHIALARMLVPHQLVGSIIGKVTLSTLRIRQGWRKDQRHPGKVKRKNKKITVNIKARIVISKDMLEQSTERVVDISGQAEKM